MTTTETTSYFGIRTPFFKQLNSLNLLMADARGPHGANANFAN